MNPFTWVFFALLSMDALRELLGLPSILGLW
ncbi:KPN_01571 family protein [Klebsiella aerogenes]|nr:KPN_01571 family protein [Klebsiella aerogenes]MDQ8575271.1 KPN_01571 family protein [Klebsiella aerogenes]MDQ8600313.1 KPN_01571 family protein [Klebsiella aerogenes]